MDKLDTDKCGGTDYQTAMEKVFGAICGEYPGAVAVRHPHEHLKKLFSLNVKEDTQYATGDSASFKLSSASQTHRHHHKMDEILGIATPRLPMMESSRSFSYFLVFRRTHQDYQN